MVMKHRLFIGLGSNIDPRDYYLEEATRLIGERVGELEQCSAVIETSAWGYESSFAFLNQVLVVKTCLSPFACLDLTQDIEQYLGRKHKSVQGVYKDRTIDIDLLLYDDLCLEHPRLVIPHPLLHERGFVLRGLVELIPHFSHPCLGEEMIQLYRRCKDKE